MVASAVMERSTTVRRTVNKGKHESFNKLKHKAMLAFFFLSFFFTDLLWVLG